MVRPLSPKFFINNILSIYLDRFLYFELTFRSYTLPLTNHCVTIKNIIKKVITGDKVNPYFFT